MGDPSAIAASVSRSLLVRGVNWLGDAVMTTPAMQRLRERFPTAQIALLTHEKLAELWQQQPVFDTVITFSAAENLWSIARRLKTYRFDATLILPNSPRSALEMWLAGIPHRIGYAIRGRNWLLTHPQEYPPGHFRVRRRGVREIRRLTRSGSPPQRSSDSFTHQIHDYLQLAAVLGSNPAPLPPRLHVSDTEVEQQLVGLRKFEVVKKLEQGGQLPIWIGLNPSAAYGPAKCWPVERFAEVAREISARVSNSIWLMFGTSADWDLCERIAKLGNCRIINLAGKTSLRQLLSLLKCCRVLLTNDTGPMHAAAALGTSVVVPFGSTSPELTGPGQTGDPRLHLLRSNAACSPCFRRTCPIDFRCMTGIPADRAVSAILESL
jgi:heptosyltransferase-2